jgi:hypothetical protein
MTRLLLVQMFDAELKYPHNNGSKVIPVADMGYDEGSNYLLYMKSDDI